MTFEVLDLGRLAYRPAWDRQLEVLEGVQGGGPDTLILVEHDSVLTLGANFHAENLLLPVAEYERQGIEVVETDRGGDVTYHGPGQLVVYPVFDIARHGKDLHRWMRSLEEAMILTCATFGLAAERNPEVNTGAWVNNRKIAAIGIKVKRWVSLHGIALNCENDLAPFGLIVPCGVRTHGVTSLSQETGRTISVEDAKGPVVDSFRALFSNG